MSSIRAVVAGAETQLRLGADAPFEPRIGLLANPYRLVVDIADVDFAIVQAGQRAPGGLLRAYRFGLITPTRGRVVFDLTGPVRIARVSARRAAADGVRTPARPAFEFQIDLEAVAAAAFVAQPMPPSPHPPAAPGEALRSSRFDDDIVPPGSGPAITDRAARARPLIVIDPGHGGIDSGAVGSRVAEKDIVLAVGRLVAERLIASGAFDVGLTRDQDVFVPLDDRARFAEERGADLFVSIHADAIGDRSAALSVRGASLYVMAERASDDLARRLAERENAADAVAGVDVGDGREADGVRAILVDLLRRETAQFSMEAQAKLIDALRPRIRMARQPARSAAFRVLRQEQTPAVLLELGYMSNVEDEKLMATRAWQDKVAAAIAEGIQRFVSRPVP